VLFPFRRLFLVAYRPDTTPGPSGVHGEIGK